MLRGDPCGSRFGVDQMSHPRRYHPSCLGPPSSMAKSGLTEQPLNLNSIFHDGLPNCTRWRYNRRACLCAQVSTGYYLVCGFATPSLNVSSRCPSDPRSNVAPELEQLLQSIPNDDVSGVSLGPRGQFAIKYWTQGVPRTGQERAIVLILWYPDTASIRNQP